MISEELVNEVKELKRYMEILKDKIDLIFPMEGNLKFLKWLI